MESTEEINMTTFLGNTSTPVQQQPLPDREEDHRFRRLIPISTIDWTSSPTSHFVPLSGLDFLTDVENLLIQQSVELSDVIANVASENRYVVRVPRGETIYYANEISEEGQRNCFGSSRAFQMQIHDPTRQLAFTLKRNLACGTCCMCWCCLQVLDVYSVSGEFMGCTEQKAHCSKPLFSVKDKFRNTIYRIEGPIKILCLSPEYLNFQIFSEDGFVQIGSIIHQWDSMQVSYNTLVQFPNRRIENHLKVLLLGAAFLMVLIFFL
ncbi:hypothetical protein WA026_010430 [Henosepilachna vigintioctopunctata]|uniref:Phospholipid scramblase n=1 Tax=Henosepilachna vigintioctopunctata TaxID=420089 RepID=A0AAW1V5L3_9CUCU